MADGAFAIFFSSPPREIWQKSLPGLKGTKAKKILIPGGGGPGGHGCTEPESTDALPGEYLNVFLLV